MATEQGTPAAGGDDHEHAESGNGQGSVVPLEDVGVSPLELFFDLVFVFALTQVTSLLAEDLTWLGMFRGAAVLTAVWWAWVGYSWLTNSVRVDDAVSSRTVILAAMAAMLVVGLAIPQSFGDDGVLFGVSYLVVTVLFIVLYHVSTKDDPERHRAVARLAPGILISPVLILIAGFFDAGWVRACLWTLALLITLIAPYISGTTGWGVNASHFAERHGLIIIIALGESLVALGLAASEQMTTNGIVLAGVLGFVVIAAFWWLYFDVVALVAVHRLHQLTGSERNALARDSYSYLHLVIVAGIVLVALGLKKTLLYGAEPLGSIPAVALFGGTALYLLGHIAFRLRNVRSLNVQRLVVAIACLAFIPVATEISAFASLRVLAATSCALVIFELIRFRQARAAIREAEASHSHH